MSHWIGGTDDASFQTAWQELAGQMQDKVWLRTLLAARRPAALATRYALWRRRLGRMRQGEQRRLQRRLGVSLAGAALLLALLAAPQPAHAGNIPVDGTTCTLAEAITSANNDNAAGNGCADGSSADTLTIGTAIYLTAALPAISTAVTIDGGGNTISRSSGSFRILQVSSGGNLTLNSATISGGISTNGGGIYASAALLTITNSTISGNSAPSGDTGTGGGIRAISSTVSIANSTISGNTAHSGGGGIFAAFGSVSISNSTLSGNSGTVVSARGGAIWPVSTTLAVSRSTLSGNRVTSSGSGGGIYAGASATVTVATSTLSGNSASIGGAISSYNGTVTVTNSTLTNNSASPTGAGFGGGIWRYGGAMTVSNSIVAAQISGNDCNAIPPPLPAATISREVPVADSRARATRPAPFPCWRRWPTTAALH